MGIRRGYLKTSFRTNDSGRELSPPRPPVALSDYEPSDSDNSDDFGSDDSTFNALNTKYGNDLLVRDIADSTLVQQLLSSGVPATPAAVYAACDWVKLDSLEILLESGGNAKKRLDTATDIDTITSSAWIDRDVTPLFRDDSTLWCQPHLQVSGRMLDYDDWYPLQIAAFARATEETRNRRVAIMDLLLNKGADLYATHRQPLQRSKPYPYPGDGFDSPLDPPEEDFDFSYEPEEWRAIPTIYGIRSVVHSIFEDGGCVEPFFKPSFQLDLERRSPQGRTILLSACRSSMGPDAVTEGILEDGYWDVETRALRRNPFVSSEERSSLFHTLRMRNADLLAVDYAGRHILHQLLGATDHRKRWRRPPMIDQTLHYVLQNLPALVNQPDRYGLYPLHAALQRWRCYPWVTQEVDSSTMKSAVDALLAAGADPFACDGRGNTALHYLADHGLTEQVQADHVRRLFKVLLDRGVDINARNKAGRTAMELMLDDDGTRKENLVMNFSVEYRLGNPPKVQDIEAEVFGWFDGAGARWTETDAQGRTLLHVVAGGEERYRAVLRARFLISKGVDPMRKDSNGQTAVDLAATHGQQELVDVLSSKN